MSDAVRAASRLADDDVQVRPARPDDLPAMAVVGARSQAIASHRCPYLAPDAPTIAAEVAEVEDWWRTTAVAVAPTGLVGWVTGEIDLDMGRVWWFGPFLVDCDDDDHATVSDMLLTVAEALLPSAITEFEACVTPWAVRATAAHTARGLRAEPGSISLSRDLTGRRGESPDAPLPSGVAIRPWRLEDHDVVGALHEVLFPGTHTTAERLAATRDERHRMLVAVDDGVVGYVAWERQADDSAYLDYLGVDPGQQRRGIGRALVEAACAEAAERGLPRAHLTVREASADARALYASCGFTEMEHLVPLRRGFTLHP